MEDNKLVAIVGSTTVQGKLEQGFIGLKVNSIYDAVCQDLTPDALTLLEEGELNSIDVLLITGNIPFPGESGKYILEADNSQSSESLIAYVKLVRDSGYNGKIVVMAPDLNDSLGHKLIQAGSQHVLSNPPNDEQFKGILDLYLPLKETSD
jgi:hypothetical protein